MITLVSHNGRALTAPKYHMYNALTLLLLTCDGCSVDADSHYLQRYLASHSLQTQPVTYRKKTEKR